MKRMNLQHPTFNIQHPIGNRAPIHSMLAVGCWLLAASIGLLLLACSLTASAQSTNAPASSGLDYSNFRVIADRNIFNPNRTASYRSNRREPSPRSPSSDSFSLVGTMLYPKGSFAFFDGTHSDYKQVLEPAGAIAGYTVKEILPKSVKLEANGKELEMKVGAQLRKEGGRWQLLSPAEGTPPASETTATAAATTGSAPGGNSGMEMNDVLRKLMEQREKELK